MQQNSQIRFINYRNGFYQGNAIKNKRNGYGIVMVDQGPIIVGNWKEDLAYGSAFAFLNTQEYAFLQFNRGELEGGCLFRSGNQTLIVHFNNGIPIDKQIMINTQESTLKIMAYRNANYQIIQTLPLQQRNQSYTAQKLLGLKIATPSLSQYLQRYFCNVNQMFQLKNLANGTQFFHFNSKSHPLSLGFVMGRNQQLLSYGGFLNDKLHSFGVKYQNNYKFQGQFQNGVLNGYGLKFGNNKYSFGRFQNGNLTQAIYLQQRSNASEQKLRVLRKNDHIQSTDFFFNGYISKSIIKFRGIAQINAIPSQVKEILYGTVREAVQRSPSSNLKGSGPSLNKILSGTKIKQEDDKIYQESRVRVAEGFGGTLRGNDALRGSNASGRRFI